VNRALHVESQSATGCGWPSDLHPQCALGGMGQGPSLQTGGSSEPGGMMSMCVTWYALGAQVLDQEGVGELIRIAVERGRAARPGLKIGLCGEQVRRRHLLVPSAWCNSHLASRPAPALALAWPLMVQASAAALTPRCNVGAAPPNHMGLLQPTPLARSLLNRAHQSPRSLHRQGGEPMSVAFVHGLGLDYVSCSPFRVPIARLAAAQAAIADKRGREP